MMKKQRTLCSILMLVSLCALGMRAATVDVRTNLWTGTQVVDDNWSGSQSIAAGPLAQATAGDEIAVTITAVSQTAEWPQMSLRKADWSMYAPAVGVNFEKTATVPFEARMTLTEAVAADIKANGCVITGCGFTMTSIDLIHKQELAEGEKGDPVHPVWTGEKVIDWSGAVPDAYLQLSAADFASAQAGWLLRFNYADLAIGAQGHISTGSWTDMPDGTEYISLTASYFEYDITEAMLAELKANGCVVSGIGFTLTGVELIDPAQVPSMACTLAADAVKCWEAGEQPQITVNLQSLEAKEMTTTVSLKLRRDNYTDYYTKSEQVTVPAGEPTQVTFSLTLEPGF